MDRPSDPFKHLIVDYRGYPPGEGTTEGERLVRRKPYHFFSRVAGFFRAQDDMGNG